MNDWMKYWLFRSALALIPRLPRQFVQRLGLVVGWALWAVLPGARRAVRANLGHIPNLAAHPKRLRRAVRQVFGNSILNYVDFFRLSAVTPEELNAYWTVEGMQQVDTALAQGRGCILICSHLGNFDYALRQFLNMGYKLTVTQEHLAPERLHQLVMQQRNVPGLHFAPVDSTSGLRALITALRRNEVVLMPADRDIQGHGEEVLFFGAPARLPTGGIQLAQRAGAPLLGVFPHRQGLEHGFGEVVPLPALTDEERAAEPDPTRRTLRQVAKLLEQQIARSPEQWAIFVPIWLSHREQAAPQPTPKARTAPTTQPEIHTAHSQAAAGASQAPQDIRLRS
jgi:lauroyl/myristoyl acyltransferase